MSLAAHAERMAWTIDEIIMRPAAQVEKVGKEGYIHGFICVRPPCGSKPKTVTASSLAVRGDGTVVHKPSGWGIGQVTHDSAGWRAGHAADGSTTDHGAKVDAIKAVARRYNQVARDGSLPEPSAVPVPAVHILKPAASTLTPSATLGKPLSGMDLWMSGEGVTKDVTPEEAKAARNVWYSDTFSYTNDYLRHGTKPSVSSHNAIEALHGGYGEGRLRLPSGAATNEEYVKQVKLLDGMMRRATPFSRPAVMYRDVSSPDQVFGPVGSMKGRVFSDPGFMSATSDPDSAERYGKEASGEVPDKIVMRIPAGGGGMRSQPQFSPDHAREKEFTFPPGTRWRVDDDAVVDGKRQTTITQLIPPGAKPGPQPSPIAQQTRLTGSWEPFGGGHKVNVETGEYLS